MTRNRLILACMVVVAVTRPALSAPGFYSISTEQVAAAVDKIGVQIAPNQITLLTDIGTTTQRPGLQVRSLERFGDGKFMVRLECENQEDCRPFMASVHVDEDVAAKLSSASSRLSLLKGSFSGSPSQPGRAPIVIRSGSSAILLLDGEHIHIRIPVICLQSGSAGQTIRATTKDHRQIYAVQVVDVGVLRGRL